MRIPVAPRPEDFTSKLRAPAVTARVGVWLGVSFGLCFLTGLISHYAQEPSQPVPFPTFPAWGYRVTQGLHVISGTAAIPLLLVKLWGVFPKLFERPPKQVGQLMLTGLERLSIAVLVGAAIFQLATGLANAAQWYPWETFSFRRTHYALGWVAIGALVVHIAVKLPVVREGLAEKPDPTPASVGGLSRRGLLRATWAATGVAVLATAGSTMPLLRKVSVLAVRSGEGPQGIPVNKTAVAAGVTEVAQSDAYRLEVGYGDRTESLTLAQLQAMEQRTEELPIACVEGWSASGEWTGVRLRDLLDLVGAPAGATIAVSSLQQTSSGSFSGSTLPGNFADDDRTLLALSLNGEELHPDHGFPARLIAPNRPGVSQTKWVGRLEVKA